VGEKGDRAEVRTSSLIERPPDEQVSISLLSFFQDLPSRWAMKIPSTCTSLKFQVDKKRNGEYN
jgi:hypothetical protein